MKPQQKKTDQEISNKNVDLVDRRILSSLRENGRLTMPQLAQKVGLSSSQCWTRVRRLETIGAIEKYIALLNHRVIGTPTVLFLEIALDRHDETIFKQFGSALVRFPEVIEVHMITGRYDYLVKLAVASTEHFDRFLRECLYRLEGIRQSRAAISVSILKSVISVDPLLMRC